MPKGFPCFGRVRRKFGEILRSQKKISLDEKVRYSFLHIVGKLLGRDVEILFHYTEIVRVDASVKFILRAVLGQAIAGIAIGNINLENPLMDTGVEFRETQIS